MTTAADPTRGEIAAAILAALAPTGEDLVAWTTIRPRVPGCFWCKEEVMLRLHEEGLIYHVKLAGRPYVCLGDDADRLLAAAAKARGRVRGVRVA
jgi:hypothetical protein